MLPRDLGVAAYDALRADPASCRAAAAAVGAAHGLADPEMVRAGTAVVALFGDLVLKLYPPFLAGHAAFERAALELVAGRLSVATPIPFAHGHHEGWPYLLMTRMDGEPLEAVWPVLDEPARRALLGDLGALVAEVHALPPTAPSPPWRELLANQRHGCRARQQRFGLPPQLLADLERFLGTTRDPPDAPPVLLTGEYTPENLLVRRTSSGCAVTALIDFGDGLVGHPHYDLLGPSTFLAAGDAARLDAFFSGYGVPTAERTPELAGDLLRLLLLHRYSNLPIQLRIPEWRRAPTLTALASLVWPFGGKLGPEVAV
jgi:hygromycin-B 7''-O-kinase